MVVLSLRKFLSSLVAGLVPSGMVRRSAAREKEKRDAESQQIEKLVDEVVQFQADVSDWIEQLVTLASNLEGRRS